MRRKTVAHFVTGRFRSRARFLEEQDYSMVLDNVVIGCVDIVVINSGEMLLGKRTCEPQPDWWIIGGRMMPGEKPEESASRNIKRELGLNIKPSRLSYLGTYSFVWSTRAQKPKHHGGHCVSITMVLVLKEGEAERINPNEEYGPIRWLNPRAVIRKRDFHPAVRKYARDLLTYLEQTK